MIDVIFMHQFGFQIMVSKNLNVDSRLVSLDAPTYSPNWVLSYRCRIGSKLGFSTIALYTQFGKIKLVLYFNRNNGELNTFLALFISIVLFNKCCSPSIEQEVCGTTCEKQN
jgi:hypothetical protein